MSRSLIDLGTMSKIGVQIFRVVIPLLFKESSTCEVFSDGLFETEEIDNVDLIDAT